MIENKKSLTELIFELNSYKDKYDIKTKICYVGEITDGITNKDVKEIIYEQYYNLTKIFYTEKNNIVESMDKAYNCLINIDFKTYQYGARKK